MAKNEILDNKTNILLSLVTLPELTWVLKMQYPIKSVMQNSTQFF